MPPLVSTTLTRPKLFLANIPTTIVNDLQPIEYGRREERERGRGGRKGRKKRKEKERDRKGEKQRRRGKALNGTINICRCNVKSATKCRGSVNVKYTRVYRIIRGGIGRGAMVCTLVERKQHASGEQHATRPT